MHRWHESIRMLMWVDNESKCVCTEVVHYCKIIHIKIVKKKKTWVYTQHKIKNFLIVFIVDVFNWKWK